MKKLFASILVLISTLGYSQKVALSDLDIDSLSLYTVKYMNEVRASLIDSHVYQTKQRYDKRKRKYVTDTVGVSLRLINMLSIDDKLNNAANNQTGFMVKINDTSHGQYRSRNGVTIDIDTVLTNIIKRGEYFNVDIKSEIVLQTVFGYRDNGYMYPFNNMKMTDVYKKFAKSIIDGYLASPNHREAVLDPDFKNVGISLQYLNENRIFSAIVFN